MTANAARKAAPHRWVLLPVLVGVAGLLVALPLAYVFHQVLVVASAGLLRGLVTLPQIHDAVLSAPLDPIYTNAMLEMVGRIRMAGVAVAAPLGNLLFLLAPGLFAAPHLAAGEWAVVLVARGSTVVAKCLAFFAADSCLVMVGILLFQFGRSRTALQEEPGPRTLNLRGQ